MSESTVRRRTGGRSARVREAVLTATLHALAEHGAEAIKINEIARTAGVHETSVYRRWPTKEHLILEALLEYSEIELPIPNTGSLRGDLIAFAAAAAAYLESPLGRTLARAMVATDDDDTFAGGRAQFWKSRLDLTSMMFDRAKNRGEVPTDLEPLTAMELIVAPLHFRVLLTHLPTDERAISDIVDAVLAGLTHQK